MKEALSADYPFLEGYVLAINKPLGWTSSDVVRKFKFLMRRLGYPKIKIGHAGTLDPMATGVLLICIGRATKRCEEFQAERKEYRAELELGATTPGYDREHPIDHTYPYLHITREALDRVLETMHGEQLQLPPTYSAKQVDGRRAYDYVREGEQVELRQVPITIYDIQVEEFSLPRVVLRIQCSKGTYIRSIARDVGAALDSGAYLTALCRTRNGGYALEDTYTTDEAETILTAGLPPYEPPKAQRRKRRERSLHAHLHSEVLRDLRTATPSADPTRDDSIRAGHAVTHSASSECAAPDPVVSDVSDPDAAAPDTVVPDVPVCDATVCDASAHDTIVPDAALPNAVVPDVTM